MREGDQERRWNRQKGVEMKRMILEGKVCVSCLSSRFAILALHLSHSISWRKDCQTTRKPETHHSLLFWDKTALQSLQLVPHFDELVQGLKVTLSTSSADNTTIYRERERETRKEEVGDIFRLLLKMKMRWIPVRDTERETRDSGSCYSHCVFGRKRRKRAQSPSTFFPFPSLHSWFSCSFFSSASFHFPCQTPRLEGREKDSETEGRSSKSKSIIVSFTARGSKRPKLKGTQATPSEKDCCCCVDVSFLLIFHSCNILLSHRLHLIIASTSPSRKYWSRWFVDSQPICWRGDSTSLAKQPYLSHCRCPPPPLDSFLFGSLTGILHHLLSFYTKIPKGKDINNSDRNTIKGTRPTSVFHYLTEGTSSFIPPTPLKAGIIYTLLVSSISRLHTQTLVHVVCVFSLYYILLRERGSISVRNAWIEESQRKRICTVYGVWLWWWLFLFLSLPASATSSSSPLTDFLSVFVSYISKICPLPSSSLF